MLVIYVVMGAVFDDEPDYGITEAITRPVDQWRAHDTALIAHTCDSVWMVPSSESFARYIEGNLS